MKNKLLSIAIAVSACATTALAQTTYTWTGGTDTDWNNVANWDVNGIPDDDNLASAPLTLPDGSSVVFNGATMPDTNVPDFGGEYDGGSNGGTLGSPTLVLNSGGTLTMAINNSNRGFWTNLGPFDRTVLTVGDGIGAAGEVTLSFSNDFDRWGRHNNGTHRVRVNSDGILNLDVSCGRWGNSGARPVIVEIDGGTVNVANVISGSNYNDGAWTFLDSDANFGGSVTFDYGGNHADYNAVIAALGTKFVTSVPGAILQVTDNGTGATVSLVVEPDPNYWTGTGGATWDQNTTVNFSTNNEADALTEGTFDTANAISGRVTFADEYFNSSSPVAVTQDTVTIATGGVNADFIDFLNSSVSYTVTSSDANGIATATSVLFDGGGTTTLSGTHAYSGPTSVGAGSTLILDAATTDLVLPNSAISNSGTVVISNDAAATQDGSLIGGAGTLEKQGTGDLTLTTGNAGSLSITAGEVSVTDTFSMNAVDIASGAVFDMTITAFLNAPNTTFTGTGILRKTGAEQVRWANQILNVELGSGALIDVQEGILRGGSNANDVWTSNLADLNVAAGATFNTHEANAVVDAITGAGTIGSGFNGAGYVNFTIGVDNGSGTFTGIIQDQDGTVPCSIVKNGSGTQAFDGENTYRGDTTINGGVLNLDFNSTTWFVPKASGVNNQINGSGGTVNLGGIFVIDLSSVVAAPGSTWQLVDTSGGLTANYTPVDFFVESASSGDFTETSPGSGIWELSQGIGVFTFTQSTGELTFTVAAGNFWAGANGPTWDAATTANFAINDPADPLNLATFDNAPDPLFLDEYYDGGVAVPVTQSLVTIGAGGVSTGTVTFANTSAVPYVVESSDANGISGTTNLDLNGDITLRGTHATTGTTTVGSGITLTLDAPTAVAGSLASAITGGGNIVKTGDDDMAVTVGQSYTGSTTVSAGTLHLSGDSSSTSVSIASGATLELDFNNRWGESAATISGDGTLLKSGTSNLNFHGATFTLGSGSLIDVQEGTFTGSSGGTGGSENWTANLSDMNVASGAIFHGAEGNIRINALNGAGTYRTGFNGAGYVNTTIGVDNGSGTFSGIIQDVDTGLSHIGNIVKIGTGTQTIAAGGSVTHTGFTRIEGGAITLDDGSSITLTPTTNGVTNGVTGAPVTGTDAGTCTLNLNGALNLDLTGTDTTPANSWLLVDATNLTANVGGTFTVTSTEGAFTEGTPGVWTLDVNGNLWTFTVSTATLTVEAGTPAGPTNEEISSGEFVSNYSFDGANANFSFQVFDGSTYEIRRTDDLTVDISLWTTVYGPTAATLDEVITPSDTPGLTEAFYVLIITDTP